MVRVLVIFLCLSCSVILVDGTMAEDACPAERKAIDSVLTDSSERVSVDSALASEYSTQSARGLGAAFCAQILRGVESIRASSIKVSPLRFINHVIRFESFRFDTFIESAVVPKKYFGFFDEEGDTAQYEVIMRETIISAVEIVARHAALEKLGVSVSEKEVALTFLAEGGALLLTDPEDTPNRVHPVRGIGLDDYRKGFRRFPEIVGEFDTHFGTRLDNLLFEVAGSRILLRPMTFREAILGTAIMYLFEKELAQQMMSEEWKVDLSALSLEEQFVATSLVYNSGIAFAPERIAQILHFQTADYLDAVSRSSKRPALPVRDSFGSLERLKNDSAFPRQLTSWNAVYHILQRYGAWIAIDRFAQIFDHGRFIDRSTSNGSAA